MLQLKLEKLPSGLGFSLVGGETGIFVKSIHHGGAAAVDGRLQVGDQLLQASQYYGIIKHCSILKYNLLPSLLS